jgi:hypothetical protein
MAVQELEMINAAMAVSAENSTSLMWPALYSPASVLSIKMRTIGTD